MKIKEKIRKQLKKKIVKIDQSCDLGQTTDRVWGKYVKWQDVLEATR